VLEAGSAEEAMAALQAAPIDVLVTDVHLPGTDGMVLAERARVLRPGAAIVFATGDPSQVQAEPGTRVLGKPYDARALLAAILAASDSAPVAAEIDMAHTDK